MKQKNKQKRFDARLAGHRALFNGRTEGKVQQRLESGGYRKPGSMNK